MADAWFFLSNCLIGGEHFTNCDDGTRARNRIQMPLGGFDVEIVQEPAVVRTGWQARFVGEKMHTTTIVVRDVSATGFKKACRVAEDICWLLRFATHSPVDIVGREYPAGSGRAGHTSTVGVAQYGRPPIDIRNGAVVRSFLTQTFPCYRRIGWRKQLNATFDYLVAAEMDGQAQEVRLLCVFSALEGLKADFARRRRYSRTKTRGMSFRILLGETLAEVGMHRRKLRPIVRLRNKIVHTGLSRTHLSTQRSIFDDCQYLLQEYLLRLIGYEGKWGWNRDPRQL